MDLSKVLGDLYEASDNAQAVPGPAAAPEPTMPAPPADATPAPSAGVPEWADDAHLDQVFAQWTPGPPADAPATEREMAIDITPGSRPLEDDLAAALSAALASAPVEDQPAVAFVPTPDPEPVTFPSFDAVVAPTEPAEAGMPSPAAAPEPAPLPAYEAAAEAEAVVVAAKQWRRNDDDVLPTGSGRRGFKLPFRR